MREKISIEDGFQVIMLFFQSFWYNFLKSKAIKTLSKDLVEDNDFFFLTICMGSSADKYFEEVIERRMKTPPVKQHDGLVVDDKMLFQLSIDFCEYFNERFQKKGNDSLSFAIDWLEDMRKNPQDHAKEWNMWNQVIIEVTEHGEKSLGFF
ncbi:MAG: hypothetical protein AB7N99_08910 [Simkaniaceae bacterium]